MLTHSCTRRRFLASTSLAVAAGAIPAAKLGWLDHVADSFVSAERASPFGLSAQAVVLEGPRMARLETMANNLPKASHEMTLNLDQTDDELLDIAAQRAGVNVRRGARLPNGAGVQAFITPYQRSLG